MFYFLENSKQQGTDPVAERDESTWIKTTGYSDQKYRHTHMTAAICSAIATALRRLSDRLAEVKRLFDNIKTYV